MARTDAAMELGALEVQRLARLAHALLAGAKSAKVLGSLGHVSGKELHGDAAGGLATDGHVKEDFGVLGHLACWTSEEEQYDHQTNETGRSKDLEQEMRMWETGNCTIRVGLSAKHKLDSFASVFQRQVRARTDQYGNDAERSCAIRGQAGQRLDSTI